MHAKSQGGVAARNEAVEPARKMSNSRHLALSSVSAYIFDYVMNCVYDHFGFINWNHMRTISRNDVFTIVR